jgi:flagellar hook-associated protein 1 FlgK
MVSLTLTLLNAVSGLQVNQAAINVTTQNVSNANTEGYSRKIVDQSSIVLADGTGGGVQIADIARRVDEFLLKDLRTQTAAVGKFGVTNDFEMRLQQFFGSPSSGISLGDRIAEFAARLQALAVTPEADTERLDVINAAQTLVQQYRQMASDIQSLRTDADSNIDSAIDVIAAQLSIVQTLNVDIANNLATLQPTGDLRDQRDVALNKIAEQIDITYFSRSDGQVVVMLADGTPLLDGAAATLAYTPASSMSASITYPSAGINGITLNGVDITTRIKSGRLKALIDMRDTTLPNLQTQIDTLATTLKTQVNTIHNDGAGFPAANSLTGTRTVASGDSFQGTGTVRIAVVNASGTAQDVYDFDLTALGATTVGNVVTQLNTNLSGFATAAITSGKLVITADSAANGIAINEGASAETVTGRGFSHYFGLNDFFVGDETVSLSANLAVRSDIATTPTLISRGEVVDPATALTAGSTAITVGDNRVVQRLADVFESSLSFSTSGGLPAVSLTLADYGTLILSRRAGDAATAETNLAFHQTVTDNVSLRIGSISGVNIDEELANTLVFQNAYAASARLVNVVSEMFDTLIQLF